MPLPGKIPRMDKPSKPRSKWSSDDERPPRGAAKSQAEKRKRAEADDLQAQQLENAMKRLASGAARGAGAGAASSSGAARSGSGAGTSLWKELTGSSPQMLAPKLPPSRRVGLTASSLSPPSSRCPRAGDAAHPELRGARPRGRLRPARPLSRAFPWPLASVPFALRK